MPLSSTRIFISYSHDSDPHRASVLALANRLRHDGLNCTLDQYVNGFPPEGWQRWMETQIETADFVLAVCTPLYLKRYRGLDQEAGRGVSFEGVVISQTLYDFYYRNTKFVPVLPDDGDFANVPLPLKGFGAFRMGADYEGLYRYLSGQAAVVIPDVGDPVMLAAGVDAPNMSPGAETAPSDQPPPREQKTMSDTMKAVWIGGAIIAGLFALWLVQGNTTHGGSSPIITGNNNQIIDNSQRLTEEKP